MTKICESDEATFERDVKAAPGKVLVDFYAQWCGPCKAMSPALETLAASTSAKVVKVDVDNARAVAKELQIRGVPTLMLFEDGKVVRTRSGAMSLQQLKDFVG